MELGLETMDDRTKSIVSHLTPIGWLISFYFNYKNKETNTSFYLRQTLGIYIFAIAGGLIALFHILIPVIIWYLLVTALLIISLTGALNGTQKEVPVTGDMFQMWFKDII